MKRTITQLNVKPLLAVGIAVATLAALAVSASAQGSDYDVIHDFDLEPGGNVTPQVLAYHFQHAWVTEEPPLVGESDVNPASQPSGWFDYGFEELRSKARVFRGNLELNRAEVSVPAGGYGPETFTADATNLLVSKAQANSEITVNPFGPGTSVSGRLRVHGYARPSLAGGAEDAYAYAFSMAAIEARGGKQMRDGSIKWSPVIRSAVAGEVMALATLYDPIEFTVEDLVTHEVVEGTLLSIVAKVKPHMNGGTFSWEDDQVEISEGIDVTFTIDQTSPYATPNGSLTLVISEGIVVESYDSGVYSGVLPPIGSQLPLAFALPSEINLEYDLGDFQDHDLDVGITLDTGGTSPEPDMSMPGDLNCDGLVDFGDINPFVLALSNPAGYAQEFPDCDIMNADINQDGFVGFDDINPFVRLLTQP